VGTRCADHVTPLYPQKLALTLPTSGSRSVGIVRVRTKATEFSFMCYIWYASMKPPSEIHLIYFWATTKSTEFLRHAALSLLFLQYAVYFIILSFCPVMAFIIKCVLKF